jgi:hypothetical protein
MSTREEHRTAAMEELNADLLEPSSVSVHALRATAEALLALSAPADEPQPIKVYGVDLGDEHLNFTRSPRGFKFMPPVESTYGGEVYCSESSSAEEPKIWVRIEDGPIDFNDSGGATKECAAHLVLDDARRLGEQLLWLCDHHYQMEDDDE